MEHVEFVQRLKDEKISVRVDKSKAGFMYETPDLMPRKYRLQQANLRAVAFGGIIVGIALFFFVDWWIAISVLLAGFLVFPQCQKRAAIGVLQASINDPFIYQTAYNHGLFLIENKE